MNPEIKLYQQPGSTVENRVSKAKKELFVLLMMPQPHQNRVARWFVFKPKIPIWVNFGGP
jgi:hypothetical protein